MQTCELDLQKCFFQLAMPKLANSPSSGAALSGLVHINIIYTFITDILDFSYFSASSCEELPSLTDTALLALRSDRH